MHWTKNKQDIYIIDSPIHIVRTEEGLYANTPDSWDFTFKFSNSTEKKIKVETKVSTPIIIPQWHFITNIRDHLGTFIPYETDFTELQNWLDIPKLKFCSSRGYYYSTFNLTNNHIQENLSVVLKIEKVHDVAVIKINDNACPPLMIYPFSVDITPYVKIGENAIEIEVIPTIRNRLIGYGRNGGKNWKNHKKKKEFMPSGLIGPVKIEFEYKIKLI